MKSLSDYSIELGRNQVFGRYGFHWNNQNFIDCLVKFYYVRWTLTCAYSGLIGKKIIIPIESLPAEEKEKLWLETKYYADGKLNKNQLVELSKALISLEYFIR